MNNIRRINYKFILFRFRESKYYSPVFYGSIVIFCVLLIIFVVVPLLENLFSVYRAVDDSRERLATLTGNLNYLSALSDTDVSQRLLLANEMFPQDKDFNGAIQAVNLAAAQANAAVGNLSFMQQASGFQISVLLQGSSNSIAQFLLLLESKIPLMNVVSLTMLQDSATVILQVAYQPYVEKNIDLTHDVLVFSPQTLSLLEQAAQWQVVPGGVSSSPVSSMSGTLPPF